MPLADEIARLEDDNHRLTEELARERQERIAETDEVTMLLKQLQIFSESLDSRAAMQRRHRVESTMRATLARMRKSTMVRAAMHRCMARRPARESGRDLGGAR